MAALHQACTTRVVLFEASHGPYSYIHGPHPSDGRRILREGIPLLSLLRENIHQSEYMALCPAPSREHVLEWERKVWGDSVADQVPQNWPDEQCAAWLNGAGEAKGALQSLLRMHVPPFKEHAQPPSHSGYWQSDTDTSWTSKPSTFQHQ